MAIIYVRSTDGSDADNGSTWALAKATVAGAAGIDAAGDSIYVSQAHAESTAAAITWTWAGTSSSPTKVYGTNDAAEPPTAVSTAATVTTTTGGTMTLNSAAAAYVQFYGLTFVCGSGMSTNLQISTAGGSGSGTFSSFQDCTFRVATTGSGGAIILSGSNFSSTILNNCNVKFGATGQGLQINGFGGGVNWDGGSIEAGSSAITNLFNNFGGSNRVMVSGVDLSNGATAMNITNSSVNDIDLTIRNCKLPASWSGSLCSATPGLGARYRMHNCDSADTNYRFLEQTTFGTTRSETTVVRSGGATDGTTAVSWKMATTSSAAYPELTLDSPELPAHWNDTVGSSVTVTVEVVTDGVTLTDGECWLEVQYMGNGSYPLTSFVSDAKSSYLATAANQTTSSTTWTTTGLASPVKQNLAVTFTPQEKGYFQGVVRLAKASTTVYVDPLMTVT